MEKSNSSLTRDTHTHTQESEKQTKLPTT